jgi:hypothetical protein
MLGSFACSLLLIIVFCPLAFLQQEMTENINKLAGENQKTWTYERGEVYMGQKNKCISEQSLTFYQNNRVTIKRCERGITISEERAWSIVRKSSIDIALKIGDEEYFLLFAPLNPKSNKEKMILRQRAVEQTTPTRDLIYFHRIN